MFLLTALLWCVLPCAAFTREYADWPDSLGRQEQITPSDTGRVRYLLAAARFEENNGHLEQGIITAKRAKKLAEQLHYQKGIAEALAEISAYYEADRKDYPEALQFDLEAIRFAESSHLWKDLFFFYERGLNCYFYLGDFRSAMELASKALMLSEQLQDKRRTAHYDNVAGFIYLRQQNAPAAETYYRRYLQLAGELKDSSLIADAFNSVADARSQEGDYRGALAYYLRAQNIYQRMRRDERLAYSFYKISYVYRQMTDAPAALPYALKAVSFIPASRYNQYDLSSYYINLGEIYRDLDKPRKAIPPVRKGLEIAEQIHHSEDIRDAYHALARTYALLGKYDSAYLYDVRYNGQKDSIINESSRREIERIHLKYEAAGKDREIALLHQRQQITQARIARERIIRNALIVLFALLALMILLLYNRRQLQQKNRLQAERNKYHDRLFNTVVAVEDKERKRIAQDIHDSLGSLLSAAKLKLSGVEEGKELLPAEQQEKYEAAVLLLDDAVTELRNISHNIMPATLSRLGLVPALKNLFDNLSSPETVIYFTASGFASRLEETLEISIYRIVLELVNNVIKHASATGCTVQLIRHPGYINIMVEDNGKGFRENHKPYAGNGRGMGMGNILSRVEYLKGRMEIDSRPGAGATVTIEVPLRGPSISR